MEKLFRYLLIGILAMSMVVDSATASRLLRRGCHPPCVSFPCYSTSLCEPNCSNVSPWVAVDHVVIDQCPNPECAETYFPSETAEPIPFNSANPMEPLAPVPNVSESADVSETFNEPSAVEPTNEHTNEQNAKSPRTTPAPVVEPATSATLSEPKPPGDLPSDNLQKSEQAPQVSEDLVESMQPSDDAQNQPATKEKTSPASVDQLFDEPAPASKFSADESSSEEAMPEKENASVDDPKPENDTNNNTNIEEELFGSESPDDSKKEKEDDSQPPAKTDSDEALPKTDDSSSFEDLFGQRREPAVLLESGGLRSASMRSWSDTSGNHRCDARFSGASKTTIFLHKSDGQHTAVPMKHLSTDDLRFVQRQLNAMQEGLAKRRTSGKLVSTPGN